jgi:hypothetical protein
MSGDGGFIGWDPSFGPQGLPNGEVYLDGTFFRDWPEVGTAPHTMTPSDGVFRLRMLDASDVVQRPFRGSKAPLKGDHRDFTQGFLVDRQSDYIALERVQSKAGLVYFCAGWWLFESFDATTGSTYTLTRPLASAIVPGVTSGTHPPTFYLNDVEDAAAASAAGQTLTALKTGRIGIWYMPVFRVVVEGIQGAIDDVNDLRVTLTLAECVTGDFG